MRLTPEQARVLREAREKGKIRAVGGPAASVRALGHLGLLRHRSGSYPALFVPSPRGLEVLAAHERKTE